MFLDEPSVNNARRATNANFIESRSQNMTVRASKILMYIFAMYIYLYVCIVYH